MLIMIYLMMTFDDDIFDADNDADGDISNFDDRMMNASRCEKQAEVGDR